MNPLKPLLFLTLRSMLNGLKRAATSPTRILYVLFFLGYYMFLVNRVLLMGVSGRRLELPESMVGRFTFPPVATVDAFLFGLFSIAWLVMLTALTVNQNTMKPADVDILFPTPISPKVVLSFRILRDYFFTLITPLVIAVLSLRASRLGWEALFRNMPNPRYSGLALRTMSIAWILMALCFVALVHALGMYINRSDRRSDRNRKIVGWVVPLYIFLSAGGAAYWMRLHPNLQGAIDLAESPLVRVLFPLPTFASNLTMSPIYGSWQAAALGALGLLAVIAIALKVAFSQIAWFYDQCAVKGFYVEQQRSMQRKGDVTGMVAERARVGKFRVRRNRWLYRQRMTGAWALVWKEMILEPRLFIVLIVGLGLMQVAFSVVTGIGTERPVSDKAIGVLLICSQGGLAFMLCSIIGQSGFNEILKRVDLVKALPFAPVEIAWKEILARCVFGTAASVLAALAFLIAAPASWPYAVATVISAPTGTLLLMSAMFLVTVLFPDLEDATQRQFRAFVTLISFVVAGFFPLVVFVGMLVASMPVILCSVASGLVSVGLAALMITFAGRAYGSFNPTE